jgi:hypothetical protein
MAVELYFSGEFLAESIQDNITANAGGGQGAAFPITTQTARITTVATAGDSVKLPASQPGLELVLINHGANPMQVYGSSTDTIDDVATATGVSQMSNSFVIYSCTTAGKWYTEGLANGYAGGFQTVSFSTGLTAAGSSKANGLQLTPAMVYNITTTAASTGVNLPASQPGVEVAVANNGANALLVYTVQSGTEVINALSTTTGFSVSAATITIFYCFAAGQWYTK